MKKNGFISTTLIFTFFILFLLLMVFLLNNYSSTRFMSQRYKTDIKEHLANSERADIELRYKICDEDLKNCEVTQKQPKYIAEYNSCSCEKVEGEDVNTCELTNGEVVISASHKAYCTAYYIRKNADIILEIYQKEYSKGEKVLVNDIPGINYLYIESESSCDTGATITYDENGINIDTDKNTKCTVTFEKKVQHYALKGDSIDYDNLNGIYLSNDPSEYESGPNYVCDVQYKDGKYSGTSCDSCNKSTGVCHIYYKGVKQNARYYKEVEPDEEGNKKYQLVNVRPSEPEYYYIKTENGIDYYNIATSGIYIYTYDSSLGKYKLYNGPIGIDSSSINYPSGYNIEERSSCTNDAQLNFDNTNKKFTVTGSNTNTKCILYFRKN